MSPDSVHVSVVINTDTWSTFFFEGGFDLLGRSIDQIRTTKQVNSAMAACRSLNLDGLVIIGGTK
jgi:pyrophosphate--fructose-6-phosphate 1-phosphotransferase